MLITCTVTMLSPRQTTSEAVQGLLPCSWKAPSDIIWRVRVAASLFICSSFGLTAKMSHRCRAETFCSCSMMHTCHVSLLIPKKCNLILINLIETFRSGNILISMSLVSRIKPYQFLFDCPPLSLFLHHLGFSLSSPGLFSVFWPRCFPQSSDSDLQTHGSLSANCEHEVITTQLCFTVNFFWSCRSIRLQAKPHCLDTGRCTKPCMLLSLWNGSVCKPTRPCQCVSYVYMSWCGWSSDESLMG